MPEQQKNAPLLVPDECGDCGHVKRIHLANVGRCIVGACTCSTFEPPTAGLHAAIQNGTWP